MSLTIQVENESVSVKRGKSGRTGKDYEIREQKVIAHGVGRFPVETKLALPDDVEAYKIGHYEVTSPLTIGRYGFDVSRDLGLVAIKQPAAKAA